MAPKAADKAKQEAKAAKSKAKQKVRANQFSSSSKQIRVRLLSSTRPLLPLHRPPRTRLLVSRTRTSPPKCRSECSFTGAVAAAAVAATGSASRTVVLSRTTFSPGWCCAAACLQVCCSSEQQCRGRADQGEACPGAGREGQEGEQQQCRGSGVSLLVVCRRVGKACCSWVCERQCRAQQAVATASPAPLCAQ